MEKEKIIGADKQADESQDKFANELLSEAELDNVAGGSGTTGKYTDPNSESTIRPSIGGKRTTGKYDIPATTGK